MGKAEFDVVLHPQKPTTKEEQRLVLRGRFNGRKSTALVMPYFCEKFLELKEVPLGYEM